MGILEDLAQGLADKTGKVIKIEPKGITASPKKISKPSK